MRDIKKIDTIWNCVKSGTKIGFISDTTPKIKVEFATVLPIKSPIARSLYPCNIEIVSKVSSGREVPKEIIKIPNKKNWNSNFNSN